MRIGDVASPHPIHAWTHSLVLHHTHPTRNATTATTPGTLDRPHLLPCAAIGPPELLPSPRRARASSSSCSSLPSSPPSTRRPATAPAARPRLSPSVSVLHPRCAAADTFHLDHVAWPRLPRQLRPFRAAAPAHTAASSTPTTSSSASPALATIGPRDTTPRAPSSSTPFSTSSARRPRTATAYKVIRSLSLLN